MRLAGLAPWAAKVVHALVAKTALNSGSRPLAPEATAMATLFERHFDRLAASFRDNLNSVDAAWLVSEHVFTPSR